jgi:vacuolar-type H+-ATPase subunit D/Vma8
VNDFFNNHKIDFSGFKKKKDETFNKLKTIGGSIIDIIFVHKKEKNETNMDVPKFDVSFDIPDDLEITIDATFDIIIDYKEKNKELIDRIIKLINVEEKTSLDLLFVMDITGSMGFYIEQAKENVLEIINRIITECPGIDINLGFIGYRDIEELETGNYIDINFTKNYTNVKEIIQNVYADGGADTPEDVSWAMENALNKEWKNNARFLVFVADAPDHGREYHDSYLDDSYIDGIPGRKNLTETIEKLAKNYVSLFCMKISYLTDEMLQMFENVYKKYEKCEFLIVDMMNYATLFTDAVVNSAIKVYENQRNVDVK